MRLIAHRGFAGALPENTRRAVEEATEYADEIEIDVRRCKSGELVVIHDATVDRVTDGSGAVADHTIDELRALDVLGTGEGVPTLSAVLRAVPNHIGVNVELKEPGIAVDALTRMASLHPQTLVSSFLPDELADCRAAAPDVPRALITDDGDDAVRAARDLGCEYVHPSVDACTERLVGAAHRQGLSVNVWTVRTRNEAERLAELGVDGIIADHWDVRSNDASFSE
ncbi:glycerophosphodiester phosphodiesterase [Natronomonas amylolytica]|uniref:glycerophosphodiester phosphodiesterase n=1 Tax=Natronomonas amylolytica TaxID=3108498 RepID=UPI003009628E